MKFPWQWKGKKDNLTLSADLSREQYQVIRTYQDTIGEQEVTVRVFEAPEPLPAASIPAYPRYGSFGIGWGIVGVLREQRMKRRSES